MSGIKKQYHHGNLHQTLIDQATDIIGESGIEGLSMRLLATQVGVSRTAAYHHFKDKNELLCAIAEQGFKRLQQDFSVLLQQSPHPMDEWLTEFFFLYINFACRYREEYDLMFGRPIWRTGVPTESLKHESHVCFNQYVDFITRQQEQKQFSIQMDALRLAQVSWSTLHGICRLLNDGVYLDRTSVDAMCQPLVSMLTQALEIKV